MSVDEAADIIFALQSIELYLLLTVSRGWTPARWERWTTAMLTRAPLLPSEQPLRPQDEPALPRFRQFQLQVALSRYLHSAWSGLTARRTPRLVRRGLPEVHGAWQAAQAAGETRDRGTGPARAVAGTAGLQGSRAGYARLAVRRSSFRQLPDPGRGHRSPLIGLPGAPLPRQQPLSRSPAVWRRS